MKLSRRSLRKMILQEMAKFRLPSNKNRYAKLNDQGLKLSGQLPPPVPGDPDYDIVAEVILDSVRDVLETQPELIQSIRARENPTRIMAAVSRISDNNCRERGVMQHVSYVHRQVLNHLYQI